MAAGGEEGKHFAGRHVEVRLLYVGDPVGTGVEGDGKLTFLHHFFKELLGDIGIDVFVIIDIDDLSPDSAFVHYRAESDLLPDSFFGMSQLADGFALGDVTGYFGEDITAGEGKVIGILQHIEFDHLLRHFVEDQGKDAVVGPDEIMTVIYDQGMRCFDGSLFADTENVNGALGKTVIAVSDHESGLVEVVRLDGVRDINDQGFRIITKNRSFYRSRVVIANPPIAGERYDRHLKLITFAYQRYNFFMSEKIITIESCPPLDIFGVNDQNLEILRNTFPKVKIVVRDNVVKTYGEESDLLDFEEKFRMLLLHFEKFNRLTKEDIRLLLEASDGDHPLEAEGHHAEVLVHGRNGMLIRARTPNQRRLVEACDQNDLVFAIGPAGTGKTYTAVALAVRALKNKEVQRIILTRPAVEAGENLGFLPGDLKEKLDPYLQPLYDALRDMLPTQKLLSFLEDNIIEIAPLAFMRGRTLNNAFVILDEAQNTTPGQLKMFLTRMGASSKFIVTGDITQIDLPRNQVSGLIHVQSILKDTSGIGFIYLDEVDIIRHKLVSRIIRAYEKSNE